MNGKIFLQKLRERGINQSQVAEWLGITKQAVSALKRTETVRTSTIETIAQALGIPVAELFEDESQESKNAELKRLRQENEALKTELKSKDATIDRLIGIIENMR